MFFRGEPRGGDDLQFQRHCLTQPGEVALQLVRAGRRPGEVACLGIDLHRKSRPPQGLAADVDRGALDTVRQGWYGTHGEAGVNGAVASRWRRRSTSVERLATMR